MASFPHHPTPAVTEARMAGTTGSTETKTKTIEIRHRFSGSVLVAVSIAVHPGMGAREELGAAVRQAIVERADLYGANLRGA
ncbi:MAG: hypothetical protein JSS66_19100, partial [Armatimonadetes bacterium]|nr:hypothetical protein [Armatimonadota bacterium]